MFDGTFLLLSRTSRWLDPGNSLPWLVHVPVPCTRHGPIWRQNRSSVVAIAPNPCTPGPKRYQILGKSIRYEIWLRWSYLIVCLLEVALVSVEYDRFLLIVFSHHFQCDSGNGWLEIGLLGIDHYAHIKFLSGLPINNSKLVKNHFLNRHKNDWTNLNDCV